MIRLPRQRWPIGRAVEAEGIGRTSVLVITDNTQHFRGNAVTLDDRAFAFVLVRAIVLLASMGLVLGSAVQCQAETRRALVMGNADYKTAPLSNPANDARLMAKVLKTVGFDVTTVINANQSQMRRAIVTFGRQLAKGDSVGLVYYAGHGVQVAGENYLIPLGADIKRDDEVALASINLTDLLRTMAHAKSRLNIAILDACRDNPFSSATRGLATRGLAPVEAPSGTLIAYATAPGKVAYDGVGKNSPYSAALGAAIPTVGVPIEEVFRQTRRNVLAATRGKQTPWEHSSLTGAFYFDAKSADPDASARRDRDDTLSKDQRLAELAAWDAIKDSQRAGDFRKHMKRYPDGLFVELAALRAERFKSKFSPWTWIITGSTGRTTSKSASELYEQALKLESAATDGSTRTENLKTAFSLYKQAAELGLTAAMVQLARSYDKGLGTDQNMQQAAHWYTRASNEGNVKAMSALGTMYEFGEGKDKSLLEALRLYRLAADAGEAHAMTSLGFLFAEGKGVAKNSKRAKFWYGKAATAGNTRAMFNLALLQLKEKRNRRAWRSAVSWLQKASDSGHTGAKRELAVLYDEGSRVRRNSRLSARYLLEAFAAGSDRAAFDIRVRPDTWSYWTRRQIQKRLRRLGFYDGHSHGFFDARTKVALEAFVGGAKKSGS